MTNTNDELDHQAVSDAYSSLKVEYADLKRRHAHLVGLFRELKQDLAIKEDMIATHQSMMRNNTYIHALEHAMLKNGLLPKEAMATRGAWVSEKTHNKTVSDMLYWKNLYFKLKEKYRDNGK